MLGLIKKTFMGLLTSIVNASNHAECTSLRNQKCLVHSSLVNLYPNACSQELHSYSFAVTLIRCIGSCTILDDVPNEVFILHKTEHLNINVFNMITEINESKIVTKHISCECKFEFDGRKCNSN